MHKQSANQWAALLAAVVAAAVAWPGCKRGATPPGGGGSGGKTPPARSAVAEFLERHKLQGRVVLIQFARVQSDATRDGRKEMAWRRQAVPSLAMLCVERFGGDSATVEPNRPENPLPFPLVRDADGSVAKSFLIGRDVEYVLVDRFGHIRYRGEFPRERLGQWATLLLAETADLGSRAPLLGTKEPDVPALLASTRLSDLRGSVKPLADYMGSGGLLLLFTDTTCPYSGQATTELPQIASVLASHGVRTVAVNLGDQRQVVLDHYRDNPLPLPVVFDESMAAGEYWGITEAPTVLFISAQRQLLYRGNGVWGDLASAMDKALGLEDGTISFEPKGTGFG